MVSTNKNLSYSDSWEVHIKMHCQLFLLKILFSSLLGDRYSLMCSCMVGRERKERGRQEERERAKSLVRERDRDKESSRAL